MRTSTLFRQAVTATAGLLDIPEIFIEKDYWVTYALHTIFHDPIGGETVFKGGTALSKCFGLIDRFSEDIDLVVSLKEKLSRSVRSSHPVLRRLRLRG